MKTLLSLLTFALCAIAGHAQTITQVKYPVEANVKVYVTQDTTSADLIVYQTQDTTQLSGNNGIWYFGITAATPKKVYFTDSPTDADFTVSFTTTPSLAGWKNSTKIALMN